MKKVFRVKGHDLEELEYQSGMDVANGDVYGFDDPNAGIIWIWVGSKSSVEESTVAAWFINKIDKERGGVPEVMTIDEGSEPMLFRENWTINVVEDDTPGFLKKAELDLVEYKLYRVFTEVETEMHDEAKFEEVEISRKSLTTGDVYILDGNDVIYCWIGNGANTEEKIFGQRLMQKFDADRHYMPLQYSIYEGDGDSWEEAFYELLDKIEAMDPEDRKSISVEDQRELKYVAEEAKSVDEHKSSIDANYQSTDPDKVPERIIQAGTDEHRKMVSGSAVKEDELPKEGTVAARLAAIKARSKESEDKQEDHSPPQGQKTAGSASFSKPATPPPVKSQPLGSNREIPKETVNTQTKSPQQSSKADTPSRDVSKTYGGAPEPMLSDLESGPDEEDLKHQQSETDLSKVKADCVAVDMHYLVWNAGKSCSVCQMVESDCPDNQKHKEIIVSGSKCSICGVNQ